MRRSRNDSREPALEYDLGNDSDMGESEPARVRELRGVGSLDVDIGVMADVDLWGAGVLYGLRASPSRLLEEAFHRGRCAIVVEGRRLEEEAEGG